MDTTTPVVVLRSVHHGGLGIARSLGRLGVPVHCVDADLWSPTFTSRYCKGRHVLDIEHGSLEDAVARLLEIGAKLGGRPILISTTDRTTMRVAQAAGILGSTFRFPYQDATLVSTLCDKSRMQRLAEQCGIPIARSVVPRSRQDLLQFLEGAAFPFMVKATDDERLRRKVGGTKFLIRTQDKLLEFYDRAGDPENPSFLVQEFIPGEDWMFNGYFDRNSECVFGATGKKIRRFPVSTGVTSLGICVHNHTVERITRQFMKAIRYRGILDIGFRYDLRNGQYRVLDVNPRIGCTFRLFAAANGMDVARALYLDLTGQPVPQATVEDGRKWIVEDFDLASMLISAYRTGKFDWRESARSLRGVRETACFALDDPLPLLLSGVADICEFYRWLQRRPGAKKKDEVELTQVACDS